MCRPPARRQETLSLRATMRSWFFLLVASISSFVVTGDMDHTQYLVLDCSNQRWDRRWRRLYAASQPIPPESS